MGKIKDFFTKIGVADSDGEEGFQNTTADTKQADNSEKEEPVPQNGRNIHNSQGEERPAESVGNDFSRGHSSKVVNIGSTAGSIREGSKTYATSHGVYRQADNMKVVVIQPRSLDDSQQIANCLKEKRPTLRELTTSSIGGFWTLSAVLPTLWMAMLIPSAAEYGCLHRKMSMLL